MEKIIITLAIIFCIIDVMILISATFTMIVPFIVKALIVGCEVSLIVSFIIGLNILFE